MRRGWVARGLVRGRGGANGGQERRVGSGALMTPSDGPCRSRVESRSRVKGLAGMLPQIPTFAACKSWDHFCSAASSHHKARGMHSSWGLSPAEPPPAERRGRRRSAPGPVQHVGDRRRGHERGHREVERQPAGRLVASARYRGVPVISSDQLRMHTKSRGRVRMCCDAAKELPEVRRLVGAYADADRHAKAELAAVDVGLDFVSLYSKDDIQRGAEMIIRQSDALVEQDRGRLCWRRTGLACCPACIVAVTDPGLIGWPSYARR